MPPKSATEEEKKSAINDAINAIESGETPEDDTIRLTEDLKTYGITIGKESDPSVVFDGTIDLNGHEIEPVPDADGNYAGSKGTKTLAMQLLKGNTVVIKDGEIHGNPGDPTTDPVTPPTKMGIQNYSNLTLDNVKVYDAGSDTYVLSNNFGEVHIKNGTELHALSGHVAFDVWYGMAAAYDDGVTVWVDTPDVVIDGPIEFGHAGRIKNEDQFLERAHLYVCADYDISKLTVVNSTPRSTVEYEFKLNEEIGYYELVPKAVEVSEPVEG